MGVLALGIAGLLRKRWCLMLVATALLFEWLVIERVVFASDAWVAAHPHLSAIVEKYKVWLENLPQLGFLFFSGTLLLLYKDSVILDWRLFVACLLVIAAGWQTPHGYFLFSLCLPYVVMYVAFAKVPVLTPILQSVTKRGDFSYGVYLYGYPVQQMLMRSSLGAKLPFPVFIGLACMGTLVLAFFSWHLVERPFLKMKKRSTRAAPPGIDLTAATESPRAQDAERPVRAPISVQRAASVLRQVIFFV